MRLRSGTIEQRIDCSASAEIEWLLALLLVAAAVLVAAVQAVEGIIPSGASGSHDGGFATSSLIAFGGAEGWLLPRWSPAGNAGLGTPEFFFYPPGAYLAASAISAVLPNLAPATILGLTAVLFRVAAILACALWLRRQIGMRAGMVGGAVYALMPYIAFVNPQVRCAFAEMAASAALPLMFLAADIGAGRPLRTVLWLAPATAMVAFIHLPTLVLSGGLVTIYAVVLGTTWPARARQLLAAVSGVALGIGLAGATVVPALLLQRHINAAAWQHLATLPEEGLLFRSNANASVQKLVELLDCTTVVTVILACAGIAAAVRGHGWPRPTLITLVIGVLLMLPISAPLWSVIEPLRRVQFPWRLLGPVSLLGAAMASAGLADATLARRRAIGLWCVALTGAWLGFAVAQGYGGQRTGAERTLLALAAPGTYPSEYFPATGWQGWTAVWRERGAAMQRRADEVTGCPQRRALRAEAQPDGVHVDVSGCTGPTLLPQFYFPGWAAEGAATQLSLDTATGLIRVEVPEGGRNIVLRRSTLTEEWAGLLMAGVALVLWTALAFCSHRTPSAVA